DRHVGRALAQISAQFLVRLDLGAPLLNLVADLVPGPPALLDRAERASEEAAGERTPRDHAKAVALPCRRNLQSGFPNRQSLSALLGDETKEVPAPRLLVGLGDVPSSEVAAPRVDALARLHERLHGLPDLVPWAAAIDVVELVEVDMVGLQPPETLV